MKRIVQLVTRTSVRLGTETRLCADGGTAEQGKSSTGHYPGARINWVINAQNF
jgi:hypothetical protein